jgi:hypothetical protein
MQYHRKQTVSHAFSSSQRDAYHLCSSFVLVTVCLKTSSAWKYPSPPSAQPSALVLKAGLPRMFSEKTSYAGARLPTDFQGSEHTPVIVLQQTS